MKSAQAHAEFGRDVSPSLDADDDADADGESELDDASSASDADEYREEADEEADGGHSSAESSDYFPLRQRRAARTRTRSGNRFHPYGNGGSLVSVSAGRGERGGRPGSPVPVPNLTKTSRGRKVPVAPRALSPSHARLASAADDGDEHEGADRSARKSAGGGGAGARTFRCAVGECGKCFIRAEHLKRHIRSIHTDEKREWCPLLSFELRALTVTTARTAHPCPKKGCDRTFSRRDNLGQHLRVHGLKL